VILDPEWLARVFTSVITSLDSSIDDRGMIQRQKLGTSTPDCSTERVIALLRHFQLSLPADSSDLELFPCRLPLGQADHTVWPPAPPRHDRQVPSTIDIVNFISLRFVNVLYTNIWIWIWIMRIRIFLLNYIAVINSVSTSSLEVRRWRSGCVTKHSN